MKKYLFLLLLLITLPLTAKADYMSDLVITGTEGIWTDVRSYSTLNDAITDIGTDQQTLVISEPVTCTTATINENTKLKFIKTGAINNSGQLTINTKDIIAENRQIFTGTGDIDFALGSVVKSGWFADLVEAIDVTSDDYLTLIISEQDVIDQDVAVGDNVTLKWEASRNRIIANAGFTLSNISHIEAGDYQLFAGSGDFDFTDGTRLNLNWFFVLRSLLTWVESEYVTIVVPGNHTVDFTDTCDANEYFDFYSRQGSFTIGGGITLTFNSYAHILAGAQQRIFLGAGTAAYTNDLGFRSDAWTGGAGAIGLNVAPDAAYSFYSPNAQFDTADIGILDTITGDIDQLTLSAGATVNEFSTDGTFAGNSDNAVPTEKAVVTYVTGAVEYPVLPRSYLAGLQFAMSGDDASHDIVINPGECRDYTNASDLFLDSGVTKRIDALWAAGTGNGGMNSNDHPVAANTWYHVLLVDDAAGDERVGFDSSATGYYLLSDTGGTYSRRLGSFITDPSSNVSGFIQRGDYFYHKKPILDVDVTNPGTAAVNRTISTPPDIHTIAILNILPYFATSGSGYVYISSIDTTDLQASRDSSPLGIACNNDSNEGSASTLTVATDLSSQIRTRQDNSGANDRFRITTLGYIDSRGRDD